MNTLQVHRPNMVYSNHHYIVKQCVGRKKVLTGVEQLKESEARLIIEYRWKQF